MKSIRYILIITGLLLIGSAVTFALGHRPDGEFSVKQYGEFHDVLHPLQHEALPKRDFARIRSKASEFVKLGESIVKLGVPKGTAVEKTAEFKKELAKFNTALKQFKKHAKNGSDAQLEASFSGVHDSFEMLAGMLPRA